MPRLYLIPSLLHEEGIQHIPPAVKTTIEKISYYVVERIRTARRFIKIVDKQITIDSLSMLEMSKKDPNWVEEVTRWLQSNVDIGVISEAGAPCIADPGAIVVHLARQADYQIIPLAGPVSMMLALMSSGFDGQKYTFHGYLPVKELALKDRLRTIHTGLTKTGYTQLWMETPYRNDNMITQVTKALPGHVHLCIASDLTAPSETIITKPIKEWRNKKIGKRPSIFLIGHPQQP
ncbi:MAG: SAM-dependent methyltransferase [Bacteroidota bacterium]